MSTTINTARVIEIGSVTAGIAVPDEGGFRFFSSGHPFDALDGRRFRSLKQATAAAHERLAAEHPAGASFIAPRPNDVPADLLLQVPGPFLLPV